MSETIYFPYVFLQKPKRCGEMVLASCEGIAALSLPKDEKKAARALTMMKGILVTVSMLHFGEAAAHLVLNVQAQLPTHPPADGFSFDAIALPDTADCGLSAVWFARALSRQPQQNFTALYNAFGALSGGYAALPTLLQPYLDEQTYARFFAAVKRLHQPENDLFLDRDEPEMSTDLPDCEQLKTAFLQLWEKAYLT